MKTRFRKSKRVYKNKGRQSKKNIVRKIKNKKSIRSIKNKKINIAKGVKPFSLLKSLPIIQNGIHIENQIIKKISGPVSFYYLKPQNVKEQGIDYPLLMLFGDSHNSRDNMCAPCNNDKGCYQIYDDRFLQLLDKVSLPEKPMDIYYEHFVVSESADNYSSFFSETQQNPKLNINNLPPLDNFQNLFYNCFNHIKRKDLPSDRLLLLHNKIFGSNKTINNKVCPTTKIRWQYADVRFCDNGCIEGQIKQYFKNYSKDNEYIPDSFEDKFNELVEGFKGLNTTTTSDIEDFSNKLFNNFLTIENKSIIRKQINKQQNLRFKNIDFWIEIYATLLINDFRKFDFNPRNVDSFYDLILPSSLVEIYIILRMMKTSEVTSIQPTICMIYLGYEHILNIVEIFTKHLGYSIDYKIDDSSERLWIPQVAPVANRCLEITKKINLSKDVDEHNKMRDSLL